MNFSFNLRTTAIAAALSCAFGSAFATNGYFAHGYGVKSKGLSGASTAVADNGFAGANNPALAAWEGDRFSIGLDFFAPQRETSNTGGSGASTKSEGSLYYVPELDYNHAISEQIGVGVTVYANGLGTDYPTNVLGGSGHLGVELVQLTIAPTIAYKWDENQSIGVSPLFVQQTFKANGLQAFNGFSSNSAALTNNGNDTSSGIGIRLGYAGQFGRNVRIGASWAPRVAMSKFSQYAGLFAEQGSFDVPENWSLGVAIQATPDVLVALDYQRINYGAVRSIANPSASTQPLGAAAGAGFGWSDSKVWKVGVQWQATPALALRAGVSTADSPIQGSDVTFNTLAPAVVTTHYTLGGTYALSKSSDISFSYLYAPSRSVSGNNLFGGGVDTITMGQQSLSVQFGWRW